jgi:predicted enzyme related to lactoylglutathione lyase
VDTRAGGGINGGIGSVEDGSTFVTFYVEADDLQAVLDRAEELGGTTTTPVTEMQFVTYTMIADPDGLLVGWSSAPAATGAPGPRRVKVAPSTGSRSSARTPP